jgi:hypothetical protein
MSCLHRCYPSFESKSLHQIRLVGVGGTDFSIRSADFCKCPELVLYNLAVLHYSLLAVTF